MIDVNKITSVLAKLPDQQLQQYAQMHKSDPYIMALAMSESNRRKEMRSAGPGAQGGQEQPKVVDQEIAQMAPQRLPEEQGIGQLPAGNMNFAEGGIVAFAGGGEARSPLAFLNPGDLFSGVGRIFSEGIDPVAAEQRRQAALRKLVAPAEETVGTPEFAAAQQALREKAAAEGRVLPSDAAPTVDPALTAGAGRKTPGAPGAAPAAAKPAAVGFREQYLKDLEGMGPEKTKTLEEIRAERAALMPKEKAYAGLEAALNKETEGAAGEKQDALWMAVTQAGLAAAAGSSPSALKNIADGFGTGLAGYKESLKEFKKADKERQKAMADIEQARRAEERGDTDAAISLREKSQDRMQTFNDRKAAGLAAITGSQIGAAATIQGAQIHADATAAAAKAPGQQERLFSTLGGGDVLKGMKVFSESMGTESKGLEATLQAYVKNPMELKASNPDLARQFDAILQQRMAGMNVTDKPSTKLRTQP